MYSSAVMLWPWRTFQTNDSVSRSGNRVTVAVTGPVLRGSEGAERVLRALGRWAVLRDAAGDLCDLIDGALESRAHPGRSADVDERLVRSPPMRTLGIDPRDRRAERRCGEQDSGSRDPVLLMTAAMRAASSTVRASTPWVDSESQAHGPSRLGDASGRRPEPDSCR